jgi:hypothetical protein
LRNAEPALDARDNIANEVAAGRDALIAMAQRLVAAPSPNPPGDVIQAADVAATLLSEIDGARVERFETAPGIVNLVAMIDSGRPGKRLVFNGPSTRSRSARTSAGPCRRSGELCAMANFTDAACRT